MNNVSRGGNLFRNAKSTTNINNFTSQRGSFSNSFSQRGTSSFRQETAKRINDIIQK